MSPTGFLPAAHNPSPFQGTALLGNHRALVFLAIAFEIDHHPITGFLELMGAGGVGEKGGKVPAFSVGMHDGEPGFSPGVEAARRDGFQLKPPWRRQADLNLKSPARPDDRR